LIDSELQPSREAHGTRGAILQLVIPYKVSTIQSQFLNAMTGLLYLVAK